MIDNVRLTRRELLLLAGIAGACGVLMGRSGAAKPSSGTQRKSYGPGLQKTMIWASAPEPPGTHFVAFRKQFTLPTLPEDARLHLFADVRYYLLWVNGKYVMRGPARFHPKGPEYDTVPVTEFLKAGRNTIAVVVMANASNGNMANASNGKMMHHAPGLTAHLEAAGKTIVSTDVTWKWSGQTRYRPLLAPAPMGGLCTPTRACWKRCCGGRP